MDPLKAGKQYIPQLHIPIGEFCNGMIGHLVSVEGWEPKEAENAVNHFIEDDFTVATYSEGIFANPMSCVNFANRYQLDPMTFVPVFPMQFDFFHDMISPKS